MTNFEGTGNPIDRVPPAYTPDTFEQHRTLDPMVVRGTEILLASHVTRDPLVQLEYWSNEGRAYLQNGDELIFAPRPPYESIEAIFPQVGVRSFQTMGFTDTEITAGISVLRGTTTNPAYISGLLDPNTTVPRVLRLDENKIAQPSEIQPVEKEVMLRVAFLKQLVGYVSDTYTDYSSVEAVGAFIDDLVTTGLNREMLNNMFFGVSLNRSFDNFDPTVVSEMKRFDGLVGLYRTQDTFPTRRLVENGEYFKQIAQKLGDMSIPQTPIAGQQPTELEAPKDY